MLRWDTTVDMVEDCICLLDADFNVVKVNKAMKRFIGKTEQEIIGKKCWTLVLGTVEPPDPCPTTRMMKSKKRESEIIELNGRYLRVTVDPILDEDGSLRGAVHIIRDIDESERDKRAIIAERDKSQKYLDIVNAIIVVLDRDGNVTLMNKKGCEILRAKESEIIGKNWFKNFIPKAVRDEVFDVFQQIMKNGGLEGAEYHENEILTTEGETCYIAWHNAFLRDEAGKIVSTISYGEDITEHRRMEEKLRRRDLQFKKLAAWAPGMIYQFTRRPDGTYCVPFTSDAIKDIFGCSPEDVREDFSPIARAILPEDLDRLVGSIEHSAKHMTIWKCEYRVQLPGQSIRWMLGHSTPEKLADGGITWYGFNTDITEIRLMEKALRESEDKYRTLYETMAQGVVYQNDKGEITFANLAAERILGLTLEQMQGRTSLDPRWQAIHEDGTEFLGEEHASMVALRTGKEVRNSMMGVFNPVKEGFNWILIDAVPQFRPGEKEPYQVFTTFTDVTERVQMEANLKVALDNMAKMNSETIEARFRAQTYFDFMAHDIANIMSPIMSYAELMSSEESNPPQMRQMAGNIVDQAQQASSLIHNLRRLEMLGRLQASELEPANVNEILMSIERALRKKHRDKDIDMKFDIPQERTILVRGGEYVEYVLLNVLDNAVRHAERKNVTIGIVAYENTVESGMVLWDIEIEDDGPGIPENAKQAIIAPLIPAKRFHRGVASSLAFCSAAVIGLGGDFQIEDRVSGDRSKGTRVIVRLPSAEQPA